MSDDSIANDDLREITSQDVAFSLWMVPILDYLVNSNSFFKFCEARSVPKDEYNRLALGYGFAVCLALQCLIQALLDSPILFGAPYNEAVERAFQSDTPFLAMPDDSAQGRLILGVARLYRPLLGVRNVAQLEAALIPIRDELLPALHQLTERFVVSHEYSSRFVDASAALRHTAIIGLHLFYQDKKMAKIAHEATFGRNKDPWARPSPLPEIVDKKQLFFRGYKLAAFYLWTSLLTGDSSSYTSIVGMAQTSNWDEFDSWYKKIQVQTIDPIEKGVDVFGGSTIFVSKPGADTGIPPGLLPKGDNINTKGDSDEDRLERLFMGYPVRMVDHDLTVSNTIGFLVALSGVAVESKEKVKVNKFLHGHHFSFAILISSSSNIGDYSTWWLFYDFCSDDSGMGSTGYRTVADAIKRLGNRVELRVCEIGNLPLRNYSETHSEFAQFEVNEPDFDYNNLRSIMGRRYSPSFRKQLESAKHTINSLRGSLLELIVCTILGQDNNSIRWGFKHSAILGDSEIDVLALRRHSAGTELRIVECTTTFDKNLILEVQQKITKISNSLSTVAKNLNWSIEPTMCSIKGLIVTTSSKKEAELALPPQIEIMFRSDIFETCKIHGIDPSELERLFPERHVPEFKDISANDPLDFFESSGDEEQ